MRERHLLAQSADDIADRIVFQLDKIAGTIDQIDAWIDQSQTRIFSCKREAARQTVWVRKIIIGTNERHPFPGHSLKALIPGVIDTAIRLGDKIGNLVDKLINNKLRAVGRTAVNDNNFGLIGLFEYAGQTFLQCLGAIVGGDYYRAAGDTQLNFLEKMERIWQKHSVNR